MNSPVNELQREREAFFRDIARMTPTQAKAILEEAWFLSPGERERIEHRADALLTERRQRVEKLVDQTYQSVSGAAERAQEEADEIVAELDRLIEETESGQVDLDDFTTRYRNLQARLTNVQRNLDATRKQINPMREKEEDPEAYWRSLEQRYSALQEGVMGRMNPRPPGGP